MPNIFKKHKKNIMTVKVRISALFDEPGEGRGAFVLKSGLKEATRYHSNSGFVIDFSEAVTWSRNMEDAMSIYISGESIVQINERLNFLMVEILENYEKCYNTSIHPFYVITDVEYSNEQKYEITLEYVAKGTIKTTKGLISAYEAFMLVVKPYFVKISDVITDNGNFLVKMVCSKSTFENIQSDFCEVISCKNKKMPTVKHRGMTKRKVMIYENI